MIFPGRQGRAANRGSAAAFVSFSVIMSSLALASYLKSYMMTSRRATTISSHGDSARSDSDVQPAQEPAILMSTAHTQSSQSEGFTPTGTIATHADRRRVVFATVVGTTVEWYDFFIYASAAGLVFGQLFFAPAGEGFAQILSFITVGISFLFRPLGAFLAGHLGDKYGRRL